MKNLFETAGGLWYDNGVVLATATPSGVRQDRLEMTWSDAVTLWFEIKGEARKRAYANKTL